MYLLYFMIYRNDAPLVNHLYSLNKQHSWHVSICNLHTCTNSWLSYKGRFPQAAVLNWNLHPKKKALWGHPCRNREFSTCLSFKCETGRDKITVYGTIYLDRLRGSTPREHLLLCTAAAVKTRKKNIRETNITKRNSLACRGPRMAHQIELFRIGSPGPRTTAMRSCFFGAASSIINYNYGNIWLCCVFLPIEIS